MAKIKENSSKTSRNKEGAEKSMKRNTKMLVAILAAGLLSSLQSKAAQYVNSPPLTEVVRTSVGSVREGAVFELPIITWGGDEATILANGNAVNTTADSAFAKEGLKFKLVREDVFSQQVEAYMSGKTPYLRATAGQLNLAAELLMKDTRTVPVAVKQLTWSNHGDCLVVRSGINSIADLKGKTIVAQLYGPHVDFLANVLKTAGLKPGDVTVKWVRDITGTPKSPDECPAAAFRKDTTIAACFVISPDADALTSGGNVGTGSEQSVKGARTLFTTRSANRIIADLYYVRSDYLDAHRDEVAKFAHALFVAEENLAAIVANSTSRKAEYEKTMAASAKILLDSDDGIADAKGLYTDCEYVGYVGNVKFFTTPTELRSFDKLNSEIQESYLLMGLMTSKVALTHAKFDYEAMKKGLTQVVASEAPKFVANEVAKVIDQKTKQGNGADGAVFSFEILFGANQNTFNPEVYKAQFDKAIDLAATYGGAILTVAGHADPTDYYDRKHATGKYKTQGSAPEIVLTRVRQAAKNLSLTRAIAVRESLLNYAKTKQLVMDPSQFAVVGHGFEQAKTGVVSGEPNRPNTPEEWASNMRVEFRLIPVGDSEASVFTPVGGDK